MAIQTNQKLYTTKEAAERLRLAVDTVRQYIHRGIIKADSHIGHWHLVSEAECVRYEREKKPRGNPTLAKKSRKKRA
jgi:excisionase family DNA binding protein